jgi:hypothetical protein
MEPLRPELLICENLEQPKGAQSRPAKLYPFMLYGERPLTVNILITPQVIPRRAAIKS